MHKALLIARGRRLAPFPGFTAIELMVVLAIAALLAASAIPSFGGIIERYRVRRASEDLTASLYLARAEAIRRGGHVTVGKRLSSDCPAPKDWSCGWVVFADANDNGKLDAGEEQIQVSPPLRRVIATASLANPPTRMKLNRWGLRDNISASSFQFRPADDESDTHARTLCMAAGGRIKSAAGVTHRC